MTVNASTYVQLYKFPLGRCVFALRAVAERAAEKGVAEVATLATRAADEAQGGLNLAVRARYASEAMYPPETVAADNALEHTLGGIAGYLDVQTRVYPGEPVARAAERVGKEFFPAGVAEISQLSFAEEHERINLLLTRAVDKELAADIELLPELPGLLTRLKQRNHEFGELLRAASQVPTREEVHAIRANAQELLSATVALIFGLHALRQNGAASKDLRAYLLEPVIKQNDALRRDRRRRRVPSDVDPDTGDEIIDDDTTSSSGDGSDTGSGGDDDQGGASESAGDAALVSGAHPPA